MQVIEQMRRTWVNRAESLPKEKQSADIYYKVKVRIRGTVTVEKKE